MRLPSHVLLVPYYSIQSISAQRCDGPDFLLVEYSNDAMFSFTYRQLRIKLRDTIKLIPVF